MSGISHYAFLIMSIPLNNYTQLNSLYLLLDLVLCLLPGLVQAIVLAPGPYYKGSVSPWNAS